METSDIAILSATKKKLDFKKRFNIFKLNIFKIAIQNKGAEIIDSNDDEVCDNNNDNSNNTLKDTPISDKTTTPKPYTQKSSVLNKENTNLVPKKSMDVSFIDTDDDTVAATNTPVKNTHRQINKAVKKDAKSKYSNPIINKKEKDKAPVSQKSNPSADHMKGFYKNECKEPSPGLFSLFGLLKKDKNSSYTGLIKNGLERAQTPWENGVRK